MDEEIARMDVAGGAVGSEGERRSSTLSAAHDARNLAACQATLRTDPLATIRTGPSLVMMLVQVVHGRDPRGAQRLSRGWRSEAREGPVDPPGQACLTP